MRLHRNGTNEMSSWMVEGQVPQYDTIKSSKYPTFKFCGVAFTNTVITVKSSRLYFQRCKSKLHVARNEADYVKKRDYFRFRMYESV